MLSRLIDGPVQILVCGELVRVSLQDCYFNGYNILCQPVDFSPSPLALKIARYCYVYYALKVIDLLDTVSSGHRGLI